jgi:hypothetical protein
MADLQPPRTQPPGRPGAGPQRQPPDPAAARAAGHRASRFGLLTLAAVLTTSLPLPWSLAALAFTVAALVVGVGALVAAVRARLRPPPVVVLSVGLALVGLLLVLQLVQVAFYPVSRDYQECQQAAITDEAPEQCDEQLRSRLLGQLLGR